MKQKDLITYGLIALGIYLITKPKEPKTSDDNKKDEPTNGGVYAGQQPNEGTPATPNL